MSQDYCISYGIGDILVSLLKFLERPPWCPLYEIVYFADKNYAHV